MSEARKNPCRHLFTDGHQCGSPALRGLPLCYHHHTARIPLDKPTHDQYVPLLPAPEDFHAIQRGFAEVLRLLVINEINDRRASSLVRALNAASANLSRLHRRQNSHPSIPVTDLVNDPELGSLALPTPNSEENTKVQVQYLDQPDTKDLSETSTHPQAPQIPPIPTQQNQDLSPIHENLNEHPPVTADPTHDTTHPTPQSPVPTPTHHFTPHPSMPMSDELRFGELYQSVKASATRRCKAFEEAKANELAAFYEAQYQQRCAEAEARLQEHHPSPLAQPQQPQLTFVT